MIMLPLPSLGGVFYAEDRTEEYAADAAYGSRGE